MRWMVPDGICVPRLWVALNQEDRFTIEICRIGLNVAGNVFEVHGVNAQGLVQGESLELYYLRLHLAVDAGV